MSKVNEALEEVKGCVLVIDLECDEENIKFFNIIQNELLDRTNRIIKKQLTIQSLQSKLDAIEELLAKDTSVSGEIEWLVDEIMRGDNK